MLKVRYSARFKKDYKSIVKIGYDTRLLEKALLILSAEQPLPPQYQDHALAGNYAGHRECYITPDWLLIYKVESDISRLCLTRTGRYNDLF